MSQIEFRDNIHVLFSGSLNHYEMDDNSGTELSRIEIKNNSTNETIKTLDFYYNSVADNAEENKRLFLDKIDIKKGATSSSVNSYILTYHKPNLLPSSAIVSQTFAKDVDLWGYYKEPDVLSTPISWRTHKSSANEQSVIYGTLKKITYPTGGFKELLFESHKINSLGNSNLTRDDFLNKNIMNTIFEELELPFNSFSSNDYQLSTGPSQTFTIDFNQEVSLEPKILNGNSGSNGMDTYLSNLGYVIEKYNTSSNSYVYYTGGKFDKNYLRELLAGSYRIYFVNLNQSTTNEHPIHIIVNMYYRSARTYINEYVAGGGLRIAKISDYLNDSSLPIITLYKYDNSPLGLSINNDDIKHFGVIDGNFDYDNFYKFNKSYEFAFTQGLSSFVNPFSLEYNISQYNYMPRASLTKGGYVGYSKVDVIKRHPDVLNNENLGHIEYRYSTAIDYPSSNASSHVWPFTPYRDFSFKQGWLLSKKIFDNNDRILTEEINSYDYFESLIESRLFITENTDCARNVYYHTFNNYVYEYPDNAPISGSQGFYGKCGNGGMNPNNVYPPLVYQYLPIDYFTFDFLKSKTIKNYYYDDSGNSNVTQSVSNYEYSPHNLKLTRETTTDSSGNILEKQTVYTDLYSSNGNATSVTSLFDTGEISIINDMYNNSNRKSYPILIRDYRNSELLFQTQFIYDELWPEQFILKQVNSQKGDDPFETRLEYVSYDEYGNILEVKKSDGTPVSYIWGYNKTLPIAKIEGMTRSQVLGQIGVSSPDETHLSQINSLRDSFSVEDPFMLTTYEYEVGIGIKSVTDPRGRVMTYHYDEFNRLKYVKDQEGNILSENEYKYATQL